MPGKLPNQDLDSSQNEEEEVTAYKKERRERVHEKIKLEKLWRYATKNSFVTFNQIKELAPKHIIEENQLDQIASYFTDLGVHVCEKKPTKEELKKLPKPNIIPCPAYICFVDPVMGGTNEMNEVRFISRFISKPTVFPMSLTNEENLGSIQELVEQLLKLTSKRGN